MCSSRNKFLPDNEELATLFCKKYPLLICFTFFSFFPSSLLFPSPIFSSVAKPWLKLLLNKFDNLLEAGGWCKFSRWVIFIVYRRFEPPLLKTLPPYMPIPPFISFSSTSTSPCPPFPLPRALPSPLIFDVFKAILTQWNIG